MKKLNPKTISSLLLFFALSAGYSQTASNLKPRFQKEIYGDVTIIANNITNRVDYSNTANVPYYNHTSAALLNDDFHMEYIDVDQDESTFSSSSAELFLDSSASRKVVYAGLYWAGTYKYNSGQEVKEGKFAAVDATRQPVNTVKLKLPNQSQYTSVTGTVIFDGLNSAEQKDCAPYVVYADITDQVNQLTNPSGVYTLADIRATQGTLPGGIAAGWQIFLVYEDGTKSKKHITTQDGFSDISSSSVNLNFNGFQTIDQGQVTARIAVSALDGDYKVSGDRVLIKTSKSKDFIAVFNKLRKPDNFFNSSITIDNKHAVNRFPDSKNTLGFDACLTKISNENNIVFGNNASEATLKVESSSDKCFLFFAALIVDESIEIQSIKKAVTISKAEILETYDIKKVPMIREMYADLFQTTSSKNFANKAQTFSSKKSEMNKTQLPIQTLNITNQDKGFYVVANAFTVADNARQFSTLLGLKDVKSKSFVNKINNYTYVYLERFDQLEDAIGYYASKAENTYPEPLYIVSVNNQINGLTDND
jgi:hypothetical protein